MTKAEIFEKLDTNHEQFIDLINALNKEDFEYAWADKWSAGQQLKHIVLSVRPLAQGFFLPRFALKLIFGKSNRPSKTYEGLVLKYNEKLQMGGQASSPFTPKSVAYSHKEELIRTLRRYLKSVESHLRNYTEDDLEVMILPHPLLGKVTVREMLYFTIHHVYHHQELVKEYLSKKV
jgi:hypothetical protein